jgi:hypothetical protein
MSQRCGVTVRRHWQRDQEQKAVAINSGLANLLARPLFGFPSDSVHYLGFEAVSPT